MKVILFGATGMIGQGTLLDALDDPRVEHVLGVVRRGTAKQHAKYSELIHADFTDFTAVEAQLTGYEACLYCLGISAAGLDEPAYRKITYDYTLAAARTLLKVNPKITFCFISGQGTDATGKSRQMWARVKGEAENAVAKLGFARAYMFRPGFIKPVRGVVSATRSYRILYAIIGPIYPLLRAAFPRSLMTSAQLGQALLNAASDGAPKTVLEAADILDLVKVAVK